jgi:membrane protein YqaA with SNARE-associated domain
VVNPPDPLVAALALDLSSPALALLSAAALGFLVGLFPIGMAEVLAVAIGAVVPPALSLALLGVFTLAHVAGKVPWYWLGTQAGRVTHPRGVALIAQARELLGRRPAYGLGLLGSAALASVPPFHVAAIAAGIVRVRFWAFLAVCLAGRTVRFSALASVPALVRALLA